MKIYNKELAYILGIIILAIIVVEVRMHPNNALEPTPSSSEMGSSAELDNHEKQALYEQVNRLNEQFSELHLEFAHLQRTQQDSWSKIEMTLHEVVQQVQSKRPTDEQNQHPPGLSDTLIANNQVQPSIQMKLTAPLEDKYAAQGVDPYWSGDAEHRITNFFSQSEIRDKIAQIDHIQCRETLCRVELNAYQNKIHLEAAIFNLSKHLGWENQIVLSPPAAGVNESATLFISRDGHSLTAPPASH